MSGTPASAAAGRDRTRWTPVADEPALQTLACERILAAAAAAIDRRGEFLIVLAGGGTPTGIYQRLQSSVADWARWRVFFGDERCLPPEHPARNSRMAADAWLDRVGMQPERIHPIPAELGPPAAARAYATALRGVAAFDLVLLGLGEDGHTASLFPGRDWGDAPRAPTVLPVFDAPKPPAERVSLSARRLSRSRSVLFLVAGEAKRPAVRQWRRGDDIPARAIRPRGGVDVLVEAALLTAPD